MLTLGCIVIVAEPTENDIHNHSFKGTIIGLFGDIVRVLDQNDNAFDLSFSQIELCTSWHC